MYLFLAWEANKDSFVWEVEILFLGPAIRLDIPMLVGGLFLFEVDSDWFLQQISYTSLFVVNLASFQPILVDGHTKCF